MKENVKKLRDYIMSMETLEDKIRALVELTGESAQFNDYFDPDEEEEFYTLKQEILSPFKEEDGKLVLDVNKARDISTAMEKVSLTAAEKLTDAARSSYIELLQKNGDMIEEHTDYDLDGLQVVHEKDLNWERAVMESFQLPEYHTINYVRRLEQSLSSIWAENAELLTELRTDSGFETYLHEKASMNAKEKQPEEQEKYVNDFFRDLEDKPDYLSTHFFEFIHGCVRRETAHGDKDKENAIRQILEKDLSDGRGGASYDHPFVEAVSSFSDTVRLAEKGKPWLDQNKNDTHYFRTVSKTGTASNLTRNELYDRMGRIVLLADEMQRSMKSVFRDNTGYKEMMSAMEHVRELYRNGENITSDELNTCREAMNTVMEKAAVYIDTHKTNRSTPNGRKRFEAAFSAMAIVNENAAVRTAGKINEVRKRKNDPQLIDLRKVTEHLPMTGFTSAKISDALDKCRKNSSAPMTDEEYAYKVEKARNVSSRRNLLGAKAQETTDELHRAASLAGVDLKQEPVRAASNVLGYLKWKHPEHALKNSTELQMTPEYERAAGEYLEFLEKNPIYEDAGNGKLMSDAAVSEHMKNTAEFQAGWLNAIKNTPVPDYGDPEIRKKLFGLLNDQKQEFIDWQQSMNALAHINLTESDSGKVYYFDAYGGVEKYLADTEFMQNASAMYRSVLTIDDPEAQFADRLTGRLIAEEAVKNSNGKTLGDYVNSKDGKSLVCRCNVLMSCIASATESWTVEQKEACMEYILNGSGSGRRPEVIDAMLLGVKPRIDIMEQAARTAEEKARKDKIEEFRKLKEGRHNVEKTNLSGIQNEEKDQPEKHGTVRREGNKKTDDKKVLIRGGK